jgi:hypothetical protein
MVMTTVMKGTEMVPKMLENFNYLTWLMAQENFIKMKYFIISVPVILLSCLKLCDVFKLNLHPTGALKKDKFHQVNYWHILLLIK